MTAFVQFNDRWFLKHNALMKRTRTAKLATSIGQVDYGDGCCPRRCVYDPREQAGSRYVKRLLKNPTNYWMSATDWEIYSNKTTAYKSDSKMKSRISTVSKLVDIILGASYKQTWSPIASNWRRRWRAPPQAPINTWHLVALANVCSSMVRVQVDRSRGCPWESARCLEILLFARSIPMTVQFCILWFIGFASVV